MHDETKQLTPLYNLHSLPTACCQTEQSLCICLQDKTIRRFLKHDLSMETIVTQHTARIACVKEKNNLIVSGAYDGTVQLWDVREGHYRGIHTFKRGAAKFKSIDMSENIIAAAQAKHIIFWDMRKMKQRTEFTDSFNDEVTCLQFDTQNPAAMMACSFDGQINKFDLSLLNEEDALIWAHRIVESPIQLHFISDVALVQTNDHILIKIDSASLSQRLVVNSADKPMRILYSRLQDMHNFEYYAYDPKESVVEYHLNHKLKAYINNQGRVELLLPCGKIVVYVTEDGLLYTGMKTKRIDDDCREHVNFTDFKRVQDLQAQNGIAKGYGLLKPRSLEQKCKKFRPY